MAAERMDAAARKRAIVETAMPLFAGKGFAGATTKEIAERAGVSEALLYRHFPTKVALYEAIQQLGCQVDPALDELSALEPSTATLVGMIEAMFQHIVFGAFDDPGTAKIRQRLMLQSLLEDGEYARVLLSRICGRCLPVFSASLAAARASGDLRGDEVDPQNAFWFAAHVACQIAHGRLPESSVIPYSGKVETVTAEAVRFCLRGIGLKDAAIDRLVAGGAQAPRPGVIAGEIEGGTGFTGKARVSPSRHASRGPAGPRRGGSPAKELSAAGRDK
jgi:TetR/AcrR family transcriptional regulator, transcriptional repressor of aconitase